MSDAFDRKVPKQESADVKRLATDAKAPKDDAPDPQIKQDLHEDPKGPLGAVVKADYEVDPLADDRAGNAEMAKEPISEAHAKGLRGQALVDAGLAADKNEPKRGKKSSPDDLRGEIADLQAKVASGQASPRQKARITEAQRELEDAQKPD